jgi:hypothetical protein
MMPSTGFTIFFIKTTFYASKDMYDPVRKRRITLGWVGSITSSTTSSITSSQGPHDLSAESLFRTVHWDSTLKQLVYAPLEEQEQLRRAPLFPALGPTALAPGVPLQLGSWPDTRVGNQSEVIVCFALPLNRKPARFGVRVMQDAGDGTFFFFVDYAPPQVTPQVTPQVVSQNRLGASQEQPLEQPPFYSVNAGTTTGTNTKGTSSSLRLLQNESTVTIRIFVDNTLAEGYWQGVIKEAASQWQPCLDHQPTQQCQ